MPLHPDDVVSRTFRTTSLRRGYDEDDVDAFLEEVVVELRRLRRELDEARAEADYLRRGTSPAPSTRLDVEQSQLEQVRREREALAAELREADEQISRANEDVARAQEQRDAALAEIEAKYDQETAELKARAEQAQEASRRIIDEAEQEEQHLAERLADLRVETEAAVAAIVGQERMNALLDRLQLTVGNGTVADLSVIAALSEGVRTAHVDHGLAVAQQLRTDAEAERDRILAEAFEQRDRMLAAQHDPEELPSATVNDREEYEQQAPQQ